MAAAHPDWSTKKIARETGQPEARAPGSRTAERECGMSVPRFELAAEPAQHLKLLKLVIRETTRLGARFRIRGGDIEIDKLDDLPIFLREALERQPSLLRSYLAADDNDEEALAFADKPGIEPVLVETSQAARDAVRAAPRP